MKKQDVLGYLRSEAATVGFGARGQMGEASRAIEPILRAFEDLDPLFLPARLGKSYRVQVVHEFEQLRSRGLRRVVRIAEPVFISSQGKKGLGFVRQVDASREWRECEITASVLERYIDVSSGACVIERFDACATLTLRQSRHIKASDQKRAKASKEELYAREQYNCPSCGALIEHAVDSTNCPYCGASIQFNFFDWQLDSFHLDMRKSALLEGTKEVAAKATVGAFGLLAGIASLFASAWDSKDERRRVAGHNNALGAGLTVFFCVAALLVLGILALPWQAQLGLGLVAAALIARLVIKIIRGGAQDRKKKQIVRYSDPYLRSCVYEALQKDMRGDELLDFSIDTIHLNEVINSDSTTSLDLTATVIRKNLNSERKISLIPEDIRMRFSRARYPERIKSKGNMMQEHECPSCGANFEPDEKGCCAYCGYGLKLKNYVWRRVDELK